MDVLQYINKQYGVSVGQVRLEKVEQEHWEMMRIQGDEKDLKKKLANPVYRSILLERFLYVFNGFRISEMETFLSDSTKASELANIMGRELLGRMEFTYDFRQKKFRCFLNAKNNNTGELTRALVEKKAMEKFPKQLRMKLIFSTANEKEKIIRSEIEHRINELLKEKQFEDFFLKQLPEMIEKMV